MCSTGSGLAGADLTGSGLAGADSTSSELTGADSSGSGMAVVVSADSGMSGAGLGMTVIDLVVTETDAAVRAALFLSTFVSQLDSQDPPIFAMIQAIGKIPKVQEP